jgi:hypothetical protein
VTVLLVVVLSLDVVPLVAELLVVVVPVLPV